MDGCSAANKKGCCVDDIGNAEIKVEANDSNTVLMLEKLDFDGNGDVKPPNFASFVIKRESTDDDPTINAQTGMPTFPCICMGLCL